MGNVVGLAVGSAVVAAVVAAAVVAAAVVAGAVVFVEAAVVVETWQSYSGARGSKGCVTLPLGQLTAAVLDRRTRAGAMSNRTVTSMIPRAQDPNTLNHKPIKHSTVLIRILWTLQHHKCQHVCLLGVLTLGVTGFKTLINSAALHVSR